MNFEVLKTHTKNLLPHEKANIKKVSAEIIMMSLIAISYALLGGDDGDENLYLRYISRRQLSEMAFFIDPTETWKIATTPTASMGQAKKLLMLAGQFIGEPTERYKQGDNKGRLKLSVKALKALPGFAQTEKSLEDSLKFLTNMN